jgi:hypothetical protein
MLKMFRMLLLSSSGVDDCMWVYCSVSVCTGVLVRFGWSRVVSECKLKHFTAETYTRIPPYSSWTAPIHQYTPKQSSTPTYSRQLLRMNVIIFETCWAIKYFPNVTSSCFSSFNEQFCASNNEVRETHNSIKEKITEKSPITHGCLTCLIFWIL